MNSARPGRGTGHRRTMERLAQARPARLDPDEDRREAHRVATLATVLLERSSGADPQVPGPAAAPAAGVPKLAVGPPGPAVGSPGSAVGSPGPAGGSPEPAPGAPRPDRRPPRRVPGRGPGRGPAGRPRPAVIGAGLTLAACAAALAVVIATGGLTGAAGPSPAGPDATHPAGTRPGHAVLTARQILLTAAVSAARQQATGRYWRVADISGNVLAAGPNAHPYAIMERWGRSLTWDARSPRQRTWTFPAPGYQSMPATPGAAAAWRADGSPRLPSQRPSRQAWWQTGGAVGSLGNGNLTSAQFQRLPAGPARLAAAVRKAAKQQLGPAPAGSVHYWSGAGRSALSQGMFGVYDQLLKLDPITPAVRAAVFRDLAQLPGVHSTGKVTDPLGRAGYGIEQVQGGAQASVEVLVIAPGSGLLLADEFLTGRSSPSAAPPPSGAVPGLARCPKGTNLHLPHRSNQICRLTVAQARQLPASDGTGSTREPLMTGTGPILHLAPGQLQSYDAIVGAGWTNVSPPLPPRAQRFSVTKDSKG